MGDRRVRWNLSFVRLRMRGGSPVHRRFAGRGTPETASMVCIPASTDGTSIRFADRGRMLSKSIKAWIMGSISRWRTPPRGTDRCDLLDSSPSAVLGHEQSPRSAHVAAKTASIAATTVSGRSLWMKCPLSCAMRNPPCGESSAVRRWISNHRAFRSAVSSCGEPRCPTDALSMSLWHWPVLMLGFSLGLWKKCHHDPAERHRSGLKMDDKSVAFFEH